jgi:hypothetical protein
MSSAIAINIYRENRRQIEECLARIAVNMPYSRVGIFLNGESRPDLDQVLSGRSIEVFYGPNYANNAQWTLWWTRMLAWFRLSQANVCFKFDPDTMVDAPPQSLPGDPYFGDVRRSSVRVQPDVYWFRKPVPFVQGGIVGLSQKTVHDLLVSKILDPLFHSTWCPPIAPEMIFMEDHLFAAGLRTIGVAPTPWKECKSLWKVPVPNDPVEHAIVHPRYYYDS